MGFLKILHQLPTNAYIDIRAQKPCREARDYGNHITKSEDYGNNRPDQAFEQTI